jgi:hypothetical protein
MYRLRISFSCLCAYLPRKDEVLVVIPDSRKGMGMAMPGDDQGQGESQMAAAVPPHVPVIELDPADLSPKSEVQPDLFFHRPDSRREWGLVFLTGNDVRLAPEPSGAPTLRHGRAPMSPAPASAAEAEDFSWIAEIAKLDPAAGIMDPACVEGGTDADGRVAARMSLRGGTLGAQLLAEANGGAPIIFDWMAAAKDGNPPPGYSQALAAGAAYDVTVSSAEVALVLTSFSDKSVRRLVLSFDGVPVGGAIEIVIKNMPLDGVLDVTQAAKIEVNPDSHFEMYYALSASPPTTAWIPHPGAPRTGAPICPAAQFALLE